MPYRILLISAQLPPEIFGGADTQCLRQAKALAEHGHKVTILASRRKISTPAHEVLDGFTIRRYYTIVPADLLGRWTPFAFLWTLQCFWFAVRHRGEFDIVHCHQGKFGLFIGAMISRMWHVPQIVKIGNGGDHMDLLTMQRKFLFGPLFLKLGLKNKPIFVAIAHAITQDLRHFGIPDDQIVNICNAIEPVTPHYHAPKTDAIQLFWHGRFEPIKNLELLVRGFALAHQQQNTLHLHLIGGGSQFPMLQRLAGELGIAQAITFTPPLDNVFPAISVLDVFVNTSFAEGMSNSLLESLSLGKLVVSTPVSGTAEVIEEGRSGFVIPEYTPKAVADTLLKAADFYAANAKATYDYNTRKAVEQFSMKKIISQYEALYATLLEGKKA